MATLRAPRCRRAGARLGRGVPRRRDRRPRGVGPAAPAGRSSSAPPALLGRHRRHHGPGQDRHRLRQAARGLPADPRQLVRGDGRAADDRLWGVGSKISARLAGHGITTVQSWRPPTRRAVAEFGPRMGPWYRQLGRGLGAASSTTRRGSRAATAARRPTSRISRAREIEEAVRELATRSLDDIAAEGRPVSGSTLKVRYAPFFTKTSARRWPSPFDRDVAARDWSWSAGRPIVRSGCSGFGPRWPCPTTPGRGTPPTRSGMVTFDTRHSLRRCRCAALFPPAGCRYGRSAVSRTSQHRQRDLVEDLLDGAGIDPTA